jgi:uncharacterized membrane-anchored protein
MSEARLALFFSVLALYSALDVTFLEVIALITLVAIFVVTGIEVYIEQSDRRYKERMSVDKNILEE